MLDHHNEAGDRRGKFLPVFLLGLVAAILGLYAAAYFLADERLPRRTQVAGIVVGGLSPEQARRRLDAELSTSASRPVVIRAGDRILRLSPRTVGLAVDVAASVGQVPTGASWNPMHLWQVYNGEGRRYEAVVTAQRQLTRELRRLARQVNRPPVHGTVEFLSEGPSPVYPRVGARLDVAATRAAVLAAYPTDRSVQVPVEPVQPRLSRADVDTALSTFAVPALSNPVTFTVGNPGDGRLTLQPSRYAERLSMTVRRGGLVPRVDRRWLDRVLEASLRRSGEAPRDATVRLVRGEPRVVPSRAGVEPDLGRATSEFLSMLVADGRQRTAPLPTVGGRPEVPTRAARAWKIKQVVSSFSTYYPHAAYRNVNIGRAAELIDGTVLQPGETFSLNQTVGERTAENGFARGFIISDGIFKRDYGGGVSQVATTLFNAAFFAGLEDVEHKPHSFYIDRYPVGREATVAWPSVDLRFRNDTKFGVLIQTIHDPSTAVSSGALTVRLWSTKTWDVEARTSRRYAFTPPKVRILTNEDCIPNTGYGGFQVEVTRIFRKAGRDRVHHTEPMHTTYIPSDTVVCR